MVDDFEAVFFDEYGFFRLVNIIRAYGSSRFDCAGTFLTNGCPMRSNVLRGHSVSQCTTAVLLTCAKEKTEISFKWLQSLRLKW
jgi:hypothetical protein